MPTIDIDFDVFKALTVRRATELVTYNDVLRQLLGLSGIKGKVGEPPGGAEEWICKGVRFPAGTEFRATYKGGVHYAKIAGGRMIVGGKAVTSPSDAARLVTGNSVNGWTFWQCRFPGEGHWRRLKMLQDSQ